MKKVLITVVVIAVAVFLVWFFYFKESNYDGIQHLTDDDYEKSEDSNSWSPLDPMNVDKPCGSDC